MDIYVCSLPTGFRDAGDLTVMGHISEAQATQPEPLVNGTRPATALAARVCPHPELGLHLGFVAQSFLSHF
jgi:hypothetical protein